jgi:ABC-type Fe3+-hydroxamate transport system substrate-binding protein
MKKRLLMLFSVTLMLAFVLGACSSAPAATPTVSVVPVAGTTLIINPHPASLEGKTVVLRWNSKPNGDKYLTRIGELLTSQVKGIKVIKLWETDPTTAVISKSADVSATIADKIAALKPDLVIAAQGD